MPKNQILQKLIEHDKCFDEIKVRLDGHDKCFDGHDKRFFRIETRLIEHGERFDKIEERLNKTVTREEYITGHEEIMTILKRLDEERIFTTEWIKRIEIKVNRHEKALKFT